MRWRVVPREFPHGFVNFGVADAAGAEDLRVRDDVREGKVGTRAPRKASVWVGTGGAFKLFWNGSEVLESSVYAGHDFDRYAASVDARERREQPHRQGVRRRERAGPVRSSRRRARRARSGLEVTNDLALSAPAAELAQRLAGAKKAAQEARAESPPEARKRRSERRKDDAQRAETRNARPKPGAVEGRRRFSNGSRARRTRAPPISKRTRRYLHETDGDDPAVHLARDLAHRAAEKQPTVRRYLLAAALAEDNNQRGEWIKKAEALEQRLAEPRGAARARASPAHEPRISGSVPALRQGARPLPGRHDGAPGARRALQHGRPAAHGARDARARARAQPARGQSPEPLRVRAPRRSGERRKPRKPRRVTRACASTTAGFSDRCSSFRSRGATSRPPSTGPSACSPRTRATSGRSARPRAPTALSASTSAPSPPTSARSSSLPKTWARCARLPSSTVRSARRTSPSACLREVLRIRPQEKSVREYVEFLEPKEPRPDEAYAWAPERFLPLRHAPAQGENRRTLRDLTVSTVFENGLSSQYRQLVFQPLTDAAAANARQYGFVYEADRQVVQLRGARVFRGNGRIDEAIEWGEGPAGRSVDRHVHVGARLLRSVSAARGGRRGRAPLPRGRRDGAQRVQRLLRRHRLPRRATSPRRTSSTCSSRRRRARSTSTRPVPGPRAEHDAKRRPSASIASSPRTIAGLDPEPGMPPGSEVLGFVHVSTYKILGRSRALVLGPRQGSVRSRRRDASARAEDHRRTRRPSSRR